MSKRKSGDRTPGKLNIFDLYKSLRKPTPKPTRVQEDRPSRTRQKADWKRDTGDD